MGSKKTPPAENPWERKPKLELFSQEAGLLQLGRQLDRFRPLYKNGKSTGRSGHTFSAQSVEADESQTELREAYATGYNVIKDIEKLLGKLKVKEPQNEDLILTKEYLDQDGNVLPPISVSAETHEIRLSMTPDTLQKVKDELKILRRATAHTTGK